MVTLNYVSKMLFVWTRVNLVEQGTNKQKPNNVYVGLSYNSPKRTCKKIH